MCTTVLVSMNKRQHLLWTWDNIKKGSMMKDLVCVLYKEHCVEKRNKEQVFAVLKTTL